MGSRSPKRERSGSRGRGGDGRDGSMDRAREGGGRDRGRSRSGSRERRRSPPRRERRGGSGPPRDDMEQMDLEGGAVAYLLGRQGATKQRLANFSGARLEIDPHAEGGGKVTIIGGDDERRLARMCIEITLQQRNNGKVHVDLAALEKRNDLTTIDVPQSCVGFVLGARGATLREFETRFRTFMFFDNETIHGDKKRLYILGQQDFDTKRLYILGRQEAREKALRECEHAVEIKMTGSIKMTG
ncbi:hypothetical protein T484DRAFT_1844927 [Baffinella frigidus]|nr:hypothetical protein T484DRAFT_1844927 [Cryptophyta sp. CCMP2293]